MHWLVCPGPMVFNGGTVVRLERVKWQMEKLIAEKYPMINGQRGWERPLHWLSNGE